MLDWFFFNNFSSFLYIVFLLIGIRLMIRYVNSINPEWEGPFDEPCDDPCDDNCWEGSQGPCEDSDDDIDDCLSSDTYSFCDPEETTITVKLKKDDVSCAIDALEKLDKKMDQLEKDC